MNDPRYVVFDPATNTHVWRCPACCALTGSVPEEMFGPLRWQDRLLIVEEQNAANIRHVRTCPDWHKEKP